MKLNLYNKKRNFQKTPEPKGKVSHQYKNLYVIQKHAATHLHYDFRLELNGILLSWAVPKGPSLDPSVKRLAMHVEDHPVAYGTFEGIIPKGEYGGGTVMLWDTGQWISEDENPSLAYQKGHLRFQLKGKKLKGRWSLIRFKSKDSDKSWFLIKSKDKYAKSMSIYDITLKQTKSILSKKSMDEISKEFHHVWSKKGLQKVTSSKKVVNGLKKIKIPSFKIKLPSSAFPSVISPTLATLVNKPPEGSEWIHEIKFDGYRILTFLENKGIRLMSRNNKEWTSYFSLIAKNIKKIFRKNIILDGEMVVLDKNQKSNFQLLQNAIDSDEDKSFIYYIFDILYYDQYDLRILPLKERKNILHQLLRAVHLPGLQYSDHIRGTGEEVFKAACEMSLEGIISKNINSRYEEKRTRNWLKIKCTHRQECVIGGYTLPTGSRLYFGSLYLGYYKDNQLIYCGNVGTGFNTASLKDIYQRLKKNIIKENPFTTRPPGIGSATWVKPVLVCEIEFSEWTDQGHLRHPSFKGLRLDKKAMSVKKEIAVKIKNNLNSKKPVMKAKKVGVTYKLTHPEKILYSEGKITKLDLAHYYEEIQDWILPHVIDRPLTIVRCPEDYKKCFYQKHINATTPNELWGISIKEKDKIAKNIYIKDLKGLMALVQMSSLEIHTWGSKINNIEYPDIIIFDLDPAPDVPWKKVVHAAQNIREHLKKYQLKSFVKTTGGKGLHVVIPIKPEYRWDLVKEFTHAFVDFLVEQHPDDYVSNMSKIKRKGKIFLDYLRNQHGATAISAYSTRARPHATIAVPLEWDELTYNRNDTTFTLKTLPKRLIILKKDPWKDFFKLKQSLRLK